MKHHVQTTIKPQRPVPNIFLLPDAPLFSLFCVTTAVKAVVLLLRKQQQKSACDREASASKLCVHFRGFFLHSLRGSHWKKRRTMTWGEVKWGEEKCFRICELVVIREETENIQCTRTHIHCMGASTTIKYVLICCKQIFIKRKKF